MQLRLGCREARDRARRREGDQRMDRCGSASRALAKCRSRTATSRSDPPRPLLVGRAPADPAEVSRRRAPLRVVVADLSIANSPALSGVLRKDRRRRSRDWRGSAADARGQRHRGLRGTIPSRTASTERSARLRESVFLSALATYVCTVRGETRSRCAISSLDRPSAASRTTSTSRSERYRVRIRLRGGSCWSDWPATRRTVTTRLSAVKPRRDHEARSSV